MAGDAVREALTAATQALCALPMHAEHREEAATAIAAFLRAIAEHADGGPFELPCSMIYTGAFDELAAAVSRAGGDGDAG